jgi:hypothetical protein
MCLKPERAAKASSPLPEGERSTRIVRCAAGEGTVRESELRGETPHPKPALRSGFDLSPPGRGEKEPLQPKFIMR